jgi:hypothetical protein
VLYIAKQLSITIATIESHNWNQKTVEAYRRQIRDYLGFREPQEKDSTELVKWLIEYILQEGNTSIPYLQEKAYAYLKNKKIGC